MGPDVARPDPRGRAVFVLTILAGSFLLFLVQPLVARLALPRLGGAPAVWNSAMLVYQALLLGGYAYAHALGRLAPRVQAAVHVAVLLVAAAWLPIGLAAIELPTGAQPALWVPWLLALSIGPLFFAVSAQAPLIQRWYAHAIGDGGEPYALYAASNVGSFAGLIAYPLAVEPALPLGEQRWLWSAGYLVLVALVIACAARLPRGSGEAARAAVASAPASPARIAHWVALAAVASGLMLATSTYITTDIVAMPLLWVLPLGLYLLSFSLAFATRRRWAERLTRTAPITILLLGGVMIGGYQAKPLFNLGVALVVLFMAAVALHTQLYRLRPAPDRLTGFYLATAAGGALGGVFAGLVAPVLFDWTYEYPLLILAAGALVPQLYLHPRQREIWTGAGRWVGVATVLLTIAILLALRFLGPAALFGDDRQGVDFIVVSVVGLATIGARLPYTLLLAGALVLFGGYRSLEMSVEDGVRTRSYFGVYTVRAGARVHELDHGTTIHGVQLRGSPALERWPTTYYAPGSGVGQAMLALPRLYGAAARVGVVGLGTGTLACYHQPGQRWRFFEIDPAIVRIARDPAKFSFLTRCLPDPVVRLGDARLSLEREPRASLDLLALDAFSSDAIPLHLMTREAFARYAAVLQPRGLLLVHISNRYLDLEPVVAAAARDGGWRALAFDYTPAPDVPAASLSQWIALSRDPAVLGALRSGVPGWRALRPRPGFCAWTDDAATILPLLRWR